MGCVCKSECVCDSRPTNLRNSGTTNKAANAPNIVKQPTNFIQLFLSISLNSLSTCSVRSNVRVDRAARFHSNPRRINDNAKHATAAPVKGVVWRRCHCDEAQSYEKKMLTRRPQVEASDRVAQRAPSLLGTCHVHHVTPRRKAGV